MSAMPSADAYGLPVTAHRERRWRRTTGGCGRYSGQYWSRVRSGSSSGTGR